LRLARAVVDRGPSACDPTSYARALVMVGGAKGMLAKEGGTVAKLRHGPQVLGYLKRAAEIRPREPEVLLALAGFYLFAPPVAGGDTDKGFACAREAVDIVPLCPEANVRLAQAYQAKGDMASYQTYLKKALELDPRNVLVNDVASGRCRFGGRRVKG
jgi:hypothetical protein